MRMVGKKVGQLSLGCVLRCNEGDSETSVVFPGRIEVVCDGDGNVGSGIVYV